MLDTKNTAGDPTGVNGATYYNSVLGKFRCFEASSWRDCSTPTARTAYYYTHDMFGIVADSTLSSQVLGVGAANNVAGVNSVAAHPGVVQMQTGTTAIGRAGMMTTQVSGILLGNAVEYVYDSSVRLPVLSSVTDTYVYRSGFIDLNTGDPTDGCFFRYSDGINTGKWQGVCRSNTTESVCDALITVAANTWYRTTVAVNSAGTSADFLVDGVSKCQISTNIATGAARGTGFGANLVKTVGLTSSNADLDYIEVIGKFTTSR